MGECSGRYTRLGQDLRAQRDPPTGSPYVGVSTAGFFQKIHRGSLPLGDGSQGRRDATRVQGKGSSSMIRDEDKVILALKDWMGYMTFRVEFKFVHSEPKEVSNVDGQ